MSINAFDLVGVINGREYSEHGEFVTAEDHYELVHYSDAIATLNASLERSIDVLRAENQSLRKDAERYRRIREGYLLDGEVYVLDHRGCMWEEEACLLDGEELDKAVDAAISSPENPY